MLLNQKDKKNPVFEDNAQPAVEQVQEERIKNEKIKIA
jgi:hypothetical protein